MKRDKLQFSSTDVFLLLIVFDFDSVLIDIVNKRLKIERFRFVLGEEKKVFFTL